MSNFNPTIALLLFAILLPFTSCQPIPEVTEEEPEKPKMAVRDTLVGVITSVNDDYVLIQKYGPWVVPEEDIVFSKGSEGETANLKYSGEQLGEFIAADIRSGSVKLKDGVYWRQTLNTKAPVPITPSEPSSQPTENVIPSDSTEENTLLSPNTSSVSDENQP